MYIIDKLSNSLFFHGLSIGFFITLAIYHIINYFAHNYDKRSLSISLIAIGFGCSIFFNRILIGGFGYNNTINNSIRVVSSCVTALGLMFLFYTFVNVSKNIKKILIIIAATLFLSSIVVSIIIFITEIVEYRSIFYVNLGTLGGLYLLIILYDFILRKDKMIFEITIIITYSLLILYQVIYSFILASVFKTNAFTDSIGIIIFSFIYTYLLIKLYNNDRLMYIELSKNLDKKVIERTKELKNAYEEIEKREKEKTNLFINLAHETKTPLTLIANYIEKYKEKAGTSDELDVIEQNFNKLKRDMVNFLDSEKLEKGQAFYEHDQVLSFSELLKQKIKLFQETAYKKQITINSNIHDTLYIKADPFAVDRITNNLLDNAIRYTNEGGNIDVLLKETGNKIRFIIKDNGLGIPEEKQKHIFSPYYQISHKKRNIQGIGIGLYIVKKIVDELKGEINIMSKDGEGSSFVVLLNKYDLKEGETYQDNVQYIEPVNTIPININPDETKMKPGLYNILFVEDNRNLVSYLKSNLQDKFNFFFAFNGNEALNRLDSLPKPHIIVSDIMMDEINGYEFFNEISNKDGYRDIPFIFLTARTSHDEKIKGLSCGAVDYIYKPFSLKELIYKINSIINNQNIKQSMYEKDKFASLGMLLGGISHEILNPLSSILGPLDFLRMNFLNGYNKNNKIQKNFEFIYKSISRIEDLLRNIKFLYHDNKIIKKKLNLKKAVTSITDAVTNTKDKPVNINYKIEDRHNISANKEILNRILSNLISNAVDAVAGNGEIIISAERNNKVSFLKVKDNGIGITGKDLPNIFNAFFTTKQAGEGIGLGLYMVKELVRKHGWEIDVISEENKGTEFIIKMEE